MANKWVNTKVVIDIESGEVLHREGYNYSGLWLLAVDNVTMNSGTGGATAAADDIGGIHHQRVKISVGADGVANDAVPVSAGLNSTAVGVLAAGLVAQLDDTTPTAVTEDQFAPVRMSSRRALLVEGVASGTAIAVTETGSATSAKQDTIISHVDGIEGLLTTIDADTSILAAKTFDFDSGVGTDTVPAIGIAVAAAGGAVAITGDVANGIDVDVTRIGGNVTVVQATAANLNTTEASASAIRTAVEKIDNIAHSGADIALVEHVPISGQFDDVGTTTVTENNIAPVRITSTRRLMTSATVDAALPAGDNNVGNVDIVTMPNVTLAAGTNTNEVVGDAAHDAAAAGNPVLVAGVAQDMDDTAPPNRVSAEADATRIATDRDGGVFVHPHGPQIWSYHSNGSTALTDASVHAAPGAGLSLYVTDIVVSSGAATAMNVFFEEGVSTVLGPYYLEAIAGRGVALHFQTPKKITANTALTVTTSAAIAHCVDVTGFTAAG